mmetsp:Transcript_32768/g.86126  ORF Transcript_32768/g.86126 Transcript_32768/m.86126 type:complete len:237 (-) Transcript_32768:277-987(-)
MRAMPQAAHVACLLQPCAQVKAVASRPGGVRALDSRHASGVGFAAARASPVAHYACARPGSLLTQRLALMHLPSTRTPRVLTPPHPSRHAHASHRTHHAAVGSPAAMPTARIANHIWSGKGSWGSQISSPAALWPHSDWHGEAYTPAALSQPATHGDLARCSLTDAQRTDTPIDVRAARRPIAPHPLSISSARRFCEDGVEKGLVARWWQHRLGFLGTLGNAGRRGASGRLARICQ